MRVHRRSRITAIALVGASLAGLSPVVAEATPGDIVPAFGGGDGRVSLDAGFQNDTATLIDNATDSTGRTVVLLERYVNDLPIRSIIRLAADGTVDPTFNGGGTITPPAVSNPVEYDSARLEVDGTGRVLYASRGFVSRYSALGVLDTSFAGDGSFEVRSIISEPSIGTVQVRDILVLPDGRVDVLVDRVASATGNPLVSVLQLSVNGTGDPAFSGDGRYDIPTAPTGTVVTSGMDLERDAAGNIFAALYTQVSIGIAKISPSGTLVTAYGGDGVANPPSQWSDIAVDASGRVMSFAPGFTLHATRLTLSGNPDASWGPSGAQEVRFGESISDVTDVMIDGSTAYLAVGSGGRAGVAALDLETYLPRTDFSPGAGGMLILGLDTAQAATVAPGPGGTLRVGVSSDASPQLPAEVVQVTTAGELDGTYANGGRATAALRRHRGGDATASALGPDGEIVTIGSLDEGDSGVFVGKVSASGVRDVGFGTDGTMVVLPDEPDQILEASDVVVLPDGRVAVLFTRRPEFGYNRAATLLLLDGAGEPDLTFSSDGQLPVGLDLPGNYDGDALSLTVAGSGGTLGLLVGGVTFANVANVFVQRVTLGGTIDQTYGAADGSNDGWAAFPYAGVIGAWQDRGFTVAGAPDGSVMWGAQIDPPAGGPDHGYAVGRLASSGVIDTAFGTGGARAFVDDFLSDYDKVLDLVRRPDGGADLLARINVGQAFVMRTTGTGAFDPGYGGGDGITIVDLPSIPSAAVSQGGRSVFAFRPENTGPTNLLRLTSTGSVDTSFGANGRRVTAHIPRVARGPFDGGSDVLLRLADAVVIEDSVLAVGPGQAEGVDAELVKIATEPAAPGAPTGVAGVRGDGRVTVTWTSPTSDGGAAVTSYQATASPGGGTCTATGGTTACAVTGLTNGQAYTFRVAAANSVGTSPPSAASNSVTPAVGTGSFVPLPSPKRFVDSRTPSGDTDDELEERFGSLNAGTTRAIPIAGRLGLTADVANVVLSVVAVSPTGGGYLTVYPCGTPKPSTSSLNYATGVNLANTVITTLGTTGPNTGKVCIYTSTKTDLVIDASGSLG